MDAEHINLLAGILFDEQGQKFTSAHTSKHGIRYRYYVAPAMSSPTASPARIPAEEIETLIIENLTAKLTDRHWLHANILAPDASPDEISITSDMAKQAAERIGGTQSSTVHQQLRELVSQIDIKTDRITLHLKTVSLSANAFGSGSHASATGAIDLDNPFAAKVRSQHLVVRPDGAGNAPPVKWLIKALARSATWYNDLISGRAASFREIADREGVAERYIAKLIPLAFLDPQLVKDCIDGRRALSLAASDLAFGIELPLDWADQRTRYSLEG